MGIVLASILIFSIVFLPFVLLHFKDKKQKENLQADVDKYKNIHNDHSCKFYNMAYLKTLSDEEYMNILSENEKNNFLFGLRDLRSYEEDAMNICHNNKEKWCFPVIYYALNLKLKNITECEAEHITPYFDTIRLHDIYICPSCKQMLLRK